MTTYIYIAVVVVGLLGYIGWQKYDYSQLEHEYRTVIAEKQKAQASLKLSEDFNKIQIQKYDELLENYKTLQKKPIITKTKYVEVKDCKVQFSRVDTNVTTAVGIPLFLGNIGRLPVKTETENNEK